MKTTLMLTALVSASALAQEAAPPPPPPPQPMVSKPADAPMLTDQDPGGRFRWGLGGLGGFLDRFLFRDHDQCFGDR